MKAIDALKLLADLKTPAFTTNDAAAALGISRSHAGKTLERLGDAGHLIRLHHGLWIFPDRADLPRLAAWLASPSPCYISLQSALYAHGLVSQIPQRVYLVSTARTRLYHTPLGAVSLHHVQPSFFAGYTTDPGTGIALAQPENALVDFLYLTPTRSRLFKLLPEIDFPKGFRWTEARKFVDLIASPRRQAMVKTRLEALRKAN